MAGLTLAELKGLKGSGIEPFFLNRSAEMLELTLSLLGSPDNNSRRTGLMLIGDSLFRNDRFEDACSKPASVKTVQSGWDPQQLVQPVVEILRSSPEVLPEAVHALFALARQEAKLPDLIDSLLMAYTDRYRNVSFFGTRVERLAKLLYFHSGHQNGKPNAFEKRVTDPLERQIFVREMTTPAARGYALEQNEKFLVDTMGYIPDESLESFRRLLESVPAGKEKVTGVLKELDGRIERKKRMKEAQERKDRGEKLSAEMVAGMSEGELEKLYLYQGGEILALTKDLLKSKTEDRNRLGLRLVTGSLLEGDLENPSEPPILTEEDSGWKGSQLLSPTMALIERSQGLLSDALPALLSLARQGVKLPALADRLLPLSPGSSVQTAAAVVFHSIHRNLKPAEIENILDTTPDLLRAFLSELTTHAAHGYKLGLYEPRLIQELKSDHQETANLAIDALISILAAAPKLSKEAKSELLPYLENEVIRLARFTDAAVLLMICLLKLPQGDQSTMDAWKNSEDPDKKRIYEIGMKRAKEMGVGRE